MSNFTIPGDFHPQAPPFFTYLYSSREEASPKNRITITRPLFSFLLEGEKEAHLQEGSVHCSPDKALALASGHCLMTERRSVRGHYSSLLFFFSEEAVSALRMKHPHLFGRVPPGTRQAAFLLDQDDFIRAFVASLREIGESLSVPLLPLKFEEFMLYLAHKYPSSFRAFVSGLEAGGAEGLLRRVVEHNRDGQLTLDELAFLCHMSRSTFKRKFEQLFGTPPIRWFHEQRMRRAARLLREEGRNATAIFGSLGYRSLSSFVQAFKKEFGVTPKAFQEQGELTL